jgi:hypothetical protein
MYFKNARLVICLLFSAAQLQMVAEPNVPVLMGLMANCLGTAVVASALPLCSFAGKKIGYNDQSGSVLYLLQQAQKSSICNLVQGFVCPVAYYLLKRGNTGSVFGTVAASAMYGALCTGGSIVAHEFGVHQYKLGSFRGAKALLFVSILSIGINNGL